MKKKLILVGIIILTYLAIIAYFKANIMIDVIRANEFNKEITIKINSKVIFEGEIGKAEGDFIQDVIPFDRIYFPRMIEIEVIVENCEIKKESYFVFIPQTIEIIIKDSCVVEFDQFFGSASYF